MHRQGAGVGDEAVAVFERVIISGALLVDDRAIAADARDLRRARYGGFEYMSRDARYISGIGGGGTMIATRCRGEPCLRNIAADDRRKRSARLERTRVLEELELEGNWSCDTGEHDIKDRRLTQIRRDLLG